MIKLIGEVAGQIWDYLDANGETSITTIAKKLNIKKEQAAYAIGWLAREGKLNLIESGATLKVGLSK